ncbi:hypothetical protein [Vibrio owensii]|uniref:hypothetical protein n=1 Tax=Vibrio harveyi group TaxID=717610 RepID=UPI003CC5BC83
MSNQKFIAVAPIMLHGIINGKPSNEMLEFLPGLIGNAQQMFSVSHHNLVEINGVKYYKQDLRLPGRNFNSYLFVSEQMLDSDSMLELMPFDHNQKYRVKADSSAVDNCYNLPERYMIQKGSIIGEFDQYCSRLGHHFFNILSGNVTKQSDGSTPNLSMLKLHGSSLVYCPAPSSSYNFYDPRLLEPVA